MHKSRIAGFFAACLASIMIGQPCTAAETGGWQFEATPYLFAAGMSGTVGVRGVKTDVDASFSEMLNHLDSAFMGLVTAQKGPWTFGLEGFYVKLDDSTSKATSSSTGAVSANGRLDVTSKMYIAQGSVGYRVLDERTKLDLIGALRYTKLDNDLEVTTQFTPGIVFPGGRRNAGGTKNWTDAVVGLRALHRVSDKISLLGYVDAGAGGSDLTYQAMAGVNWEFGKGYTAKLGYRYLHWDYKDNGFTWDVALKGPYLGLGIRF